MRDDFAGFAGDEFVYSLVAAADDMMVPGAAHGFPSGVLDLLGDEIPT